MSWIANALLVVLLFPGLGAFARSSKLNLQPKTLVKVNELLSQTSKLHEALYSQEEKLVAVYAKEISKEIDKMVRSIHEFQLENQEMHLKIILESTKEYLDSFQNLPKEEDKMTNLKKAFSQLVQLVRIYEVDKKYLMYYCKDDNSEWVQSGKGGARNPIHPVKHGRCGDRVYR